jgi:hypothetical protein
VRIQNLKTPLETPMASPAPPLSVAQAAAAPPSSEAAGPGTAVEQRQAMEIALLKARVAHLELVVETARNLMGSNQECLLRRLYEVPRELVELTAQLRRVDPHASL